MTEGEAALLVGVISDTHGQLPPAAARALAGVDRILHAGDVGEGCVLEELEAIAPVTAVRGNCDHGPRVSRLPAVANGTVGGVRFVVAHQKADALRAMLQPGAGGVALVVSGHTHRPHLERRGGVVFLNPGSASAGRGAPESVALVSVGEAGLDVRFVELG